MKRQVRQGTFETNSSSTHSLTIVDRTNVIEEGKIPGNTTFEFDGYRVFEEYEEQDCNEFEGDWDVTYFKTEQEKLALCLVICQTLYEREQDIFYFDYGRKAMERGVSIDEVLKEIEIFSDLYKIVKDVRNTDLVVKSIGSFSGSLNDVGDVSNLVKDYLKKKPESKTAYDMFKDILFGEYDVKDKCYCDD